MRYIIFILLLFISLASFSQGGKLIRIKVNKGEPGSTGLTGANGTNGDDGREVELQNTGSFIQWRYVGDVSWTNLIAISAITGPTGSTGPTGPAGSNGTNGTNGTNGSNGTNGADGTTWYDGTGAPSGGLGINGDYYLNDANGDVYVKSGGSWSITANIKGLDGLGAGTVTIVTGSAPIVITSTATTTPNVTIDTTSSYGAGTQYDLTLKENKLTGTAGQTLRFTATNTVVASGALYNDGTNIGIGDAAPAQRLSINGNMKLSGAFIDGYLNAGTAGQVIGNVGGYSTEWITPKAYLDTLNGLFAATQTFGTGTTGTDFNISSSGATHTFHFPNASGSNRGLLTSTDWTTFNGKENALTFNAPLSRSVNTIAIPAATSSVSGHLTSADWTTFNGKVGGSGTSTRLAFWSGTSILSSNANAYWDNSNSRLGIGTTTPAQSIHSTGTIRADGALNINNKYKIETTGDDLYIQPVTTNGFIRYKKADYNDVLAFDIANQRMGIGNSIPLYTIDGGIPGSTGNLFRLVTNAKTLWTTTDALTTVHLSGFLINSTGLNNAFSLENATGNIGLGLTPTVKLDVEGTTPVLRLSDLNGDITTDETIGELRYYSKEGDGNRISGFVKSVGNELYGRKSYLSFGTSITNNADAIEQMRLHSTLRVTALDTDGSAPSTSGTTRMVTTDGNGDLSFTTIPTGTVTSIATNNGITGGTITTTGTIGLTGQALAVHNLASNGLIARTSSGNVSARTLTAGNGIAVTNGDGVSGNPTIAQSMKYASAYANTETFTLTSSDLKKFDIVGEHQSQGMTVDGTDNWVELSETGDYEVTISGQYESADGTGNYYISAKKNSDVGVVDGVLLKDPVGIVPFSFTFIEGFTAGDNVYGAIYCLTGETNDKIHNYKITVKRLY